MSDTPSSSVSWQVYVDQRFSDQALAVGTAIAAAQRATEKAESAIERRFDSVNEFRGALADATRLQLSRAEYEASHIAMTEKVDALSQRIAAQELVKQGRAATWAYIVGALGSLGMLFSLFYYALQFRKLVP